MDVINPGEVFRTPGPEDLKSQRRADKAHQSQTQRLQEEKPKAS